ncbi:ras-related protein Ral-A [Histomonas meleagridis]|uniref:ras-related protein Ral-A n=1 Tax=Histomonas meleagridis TaxID=135588 RepID=UPI00355AC55B|nr:ras-related protein Ral-A [Histomonas meleagridis]KAH0805443.1 ras-related protein Ral-A [Histomonas meleagridis]
MVVIVGDGGVGKTSIVVRYIRDKFTLGYEPTLENNYECEIKMADGRVLNVEIADTAGQEEYKALRDKFLADGDAFIVVYSIVELSSLKMTENLLEQISVLKEGEPFKFILLGNKCDLADQRQVPSQEGKAIADKYKGLFLETSAMTKAGVDEAFQKIGELLLRKDEGKGGCCNIQ